MEALSENKIDTKRLIKSKTPSSLWLSKLIELIDDGGLSDSDRCHILTSNDSKLPSPLILSGSLVSQVADEALRLLLGIPSKLLSLVEMEFWICLVLMDLIRKGFVVLLIFLWSDVGFDSTTISTGGLIGFWLWIWWLELEITTLLLNGIFKGTWLNSSLKLFLNEWFMCVLLRFEPSDEVRPFGFLHLNYKK